jgi:alpha-beta hydrolase superfamily lysophospholipase
MLVPIGVFFSGPVLLHYFEPKFLSTGPNGPETPASVGVIYERIGIPSADRTLDGYLVMAARPCEPKVALLIFHGVMETISEWVKAQRFLYDHCISSVVFDYSGHGNSSRPGTIKNLNHDSAAAYVWFAARFAGDSRLCVLGHSMGNGPMLEALPDFRPTPACVVVANAFSSLREAGAHRGTPRLLVSMMPDAWNNVKNIEHTRSPLMLVHSDADLVNALAMGQQIFQSAPEPKEMVIQHGFKHNALYKEPNDEWWTPVLRFLYGEKR